MAFIHHDIFEVGQNAGELRVHRQNASVQHVWIGDQQLSSVPGLTSVSLHATQNAFVKVLISKSMRF